jgi:hypothetical protein
MTGITYQVVMKAILGAEKGIEFLLFIILANSYLSHELSS